MKDYAKEMLDQIQATKNADRRITVTLDAETVRLVRKWQLENLANTVRFMLKIADAQLTEQQKRNESVGTPNNPLG